MLTTEKWENNNNNYLLHGLWNPEDQCRIHKGSPIIPILSRINPNTRIDTYLFKVHSNIVLPSTPRPPQKSLSLGLPVKILKALLAFSILATCPAHLNLLDLIILTMLGDCHYTRIYHIYIYIYIYIYNFSNIRIIPSSEIKFCL